MPSCTGIQAAKTFSVHFSRPRVVAGASRGRDVASSASAATSVTGKAFPLCCDAVGSVKEDAKVFVFVFPGGGESMP